MIHPFLPLLVSTLILSAAASAPAQEIPPAPPFRAGAATSNLTPPLGASLDGTIQQNGPASHVHDELLARCLVLDDGKTRVAFAIVDSTMISRQVMDQARAIIEEQSALPGHHVLIAATHTHSSPRAVPGLNDAEIDLAYLDFMARRIADGVQRAINHLAPARIGWASAAKSDWVHNRRWLMEPDKILPNPFGHTGERVTMNPPAGSPHLLKPAGPVDPELFVLSVRHLDGRPLAILANYGTHYVGGTRRGHVSADYFGAFATHIAYLLEADRSDPPFVGILSNGTSGDVNTLDFSKPRPKADAPYQRIKLIAEDVADSAQRIESSIQYHDHVPLAVAKTELMLGVRKPDAALLKWANETYAGEKPPPGKTQLSRPQIYARENLHLSRYPDELSIMLQAIRIGDLAITAVPCETFAETGLTIKNASPFSATFTIELANGFFGYLPSPQQHLWGGYETWPARSSLLEVQAEPKIRKTILDLLNELHPKP